MYVYIYIYIKKLFNTYGLNVSKISISKKRPYGKKSSFKYCVVGYNDGDDDDDDDDDDGDGIRALCIKFHQMIGFVKCFHSLMIIIY